MFATKDQKGEAVIVGGCYTYVPSSAPIYNYSPFARGGIISARSISHHFTRIRQEDSKNEVSI